MKNIYWILAIAFLPGIYSCKKIESLPAVPYIEYRSFEVFDSVDILGNRDKTGRLKFYFEDGDGDLGRFTGEESEESEGNDISIILYRKSEGVMVPAYYDESEHTIIYNFLRQEKEGQNKILKGTIEVTLLDLSSFFSLTDTARFDFYITDRAMNESNVASTNEVVISENGIY